MSFNMKELNAYSTKGRMCLLLFLSIAAEELMRKYNSNSLKIVNLKLDSITGLTVLSAQRPMSK